MVAEMVAHHSNTTPRQAAVDWRGVSAGGLDLVEQFDRAISILTDEVLAHVTEGRPTLETVLRDQCNRMIDEQLGIFRAKCEIRERAAALRLQEKNKSIQRMFLIKDEQIRTAEAKLAGQVKASRSSRVQSLEVLQSLHEARSAGPHLLLQLWAAAARDQRQQAACQQLSESLTAAQAASSLLQEQLAGAEATSRTFRERLEAMELERDKLNEALQHAEAANERLREHVRLVEAANDKLKEQVLAAEDLSKCGLKSARRPKAGQENDPPKNILEDILQASARSRTPPFLPSSRALPEKVTAASVVAVVPPAPATFECHSSPVMEAQALQVPTPAATTSVLLNDMHIRSGHVRSLSSSQLPLGPRLSEEHVPAASSQRTATPPRHRVQTPRTLTRMVSDQNASPLGSARGFDPQGSAVAAAITTSALATAPAVLNSTSVTGSFTPLPPSMPTVTALPSTTAWVPSHRRTGSSGMSPPPSPLVVGRPPSPLLPCRQASPLTASLGSGLLPPGGSGGGMPRGPAPALPGSTGSAPRPSPRNSPLSRSYTAAASSSAPALLRPCPATGRSTPQLPPGCQQIPPQAQSSAVAPISAAGSQAAGYMPAAGGPWNSSYVAVSGASTPHCPAALSRPAVGSPSPYLIRRA